MPKRNLIWTVAIVAAALAALFLTRNRPPSGTPGVGYVDPIANAVRLIRKNYLYDLDEGELRQAAMRGLIEQLDPYSTYFPPGAVGAFDDRMDGQAFGTGMHVDISDGAAAVIGPLPDSPALRAGIRAGDRIVEIDGNRVATMTGERIGKLLNPPGPDAATIHLRVRRDGEPPEVIGLRPGTYPLRTVGGLFRDRDNRWVHFAPGQEDILYVRIREFVPDTHQRVRGVLRRFDKARGLVLDLRDNPGGRLPIAWRVGNLFLDGGVIVIMEHKSGRIERHEADSPGTFPAKIPMVVLIDAQTASGAELVAAALQYHGRAVLVGTRTLGKGCVQSMIDLGKGLGRLNLTTAEFYVDETLRIARRRGSDRWGVEADVEVLLPEVYRKSLRRLRLAGEVIAAPAPETRPASTHSAPSDDDAGRKIFTLDAQLRRALALLNEPSEIDAILERAAQTRADRRRPASKDKQDSTKPADRPAERRHAPGAGE